MHMTLLRRLLPIAALALPLLAATAPAKAQDPSFRLNNSTGQTINEVYVSSSQQRDWGADLLGAGVLLNGNTLTIRIRDGQCLNDIRVIYASGRSQEWLQRNTCQITDININ